MDISVSPRTKPSDDIFGYKPFVDGLRAVSIISVVAFHLGLPGVTGGFVGVDVFFVISGYLIINQIVAGLKTGRFRFGEFWARRVLRILPPYFLVLGACLAIAPFVLVSPDEFAEFGREARASALMIVNHYFLTQQGYFDGAADTKPLLHMWTLAVEEQFYLFAPLLLVGLWWARRRLGRHGDLAWVGGASVVGVVSFVLCVAYTLPDRNPAFFLMPFRAWEFVLGGAVPFLVPTVRRLPWWGGTVVAIVGAGLIAFAVFRLDGNNYPSAAALIPVGGACLVILAGLASPANPVAILLSTRPMVWVGLISYAWYLWHWPLLTFMRIWDFGDPVLANDSAAIALSFVLAALTHHFLEIPIKRWRQRSHTAWRNWEVIAAGILGAAAFALAGLIYVTVVTPAVERRLPATMLTRIDRTITKRDQCAPGSRKFAPKACLAGAAGKPLGLLIGNSHARMIYRAVRDGAHAAGAELATLWEPGCKPYFSNGGYTFATVPEDCARWFARGMKAVAAMFADRPPDYAILSVNWTTEEPSSVDRSALDSALKQAGLGSIDDHRLPELVLGLSATIGRLEALGTKRILIVGPPARFARLAPPCLLRADFRGISRDVCAATRAEVEAGREAAMETLKFVADRFPNVRLIDPLDTFCDHELCRPVEADVVLFDDNHHLSEAGARKLLAAFAPDFDWAFRGDAVDAAPAEGQNAPVATPPPN